MIVYGFMIYSPGPRSTSLSDSSWDSDRLCITDDIEKGEYYLAPQDRVKFLELD